MFDDGIKTLEKNESLGASLLSRVLIPNRGKILGRFFEIVLHTRYIFQDEKRSEDAVFNAVHRITMQKRLQRLENKVVSNT